jgi:hypothetical protein
MSGGCAARKSPMWIGSWDAYGEIPSNSVESVARFSHKATTRPDVRIATTDKGILKGTTDKEGTTGTTGGEVMTGITGRDLTMMTTNRDDRPPIHHPRFGLRDRAITIGKRTA